MVEARTAVLTKQPLSLLSELLVKPACSSVTRPMHFLESTSPPCEYPRRAEDQLVWDVFFLFCCKALVSPYMNH